MDRTNVTFDNLRARGGRVTHARKAVLEALMESNSHVTADDLLSIVQTTYPDIHLSTIYRTLDALEHLGVVDHVHLGHGKAVYHLASNSHQHIVCESCSIVEEVPVELFTDLENVLMDKYQFKIRMNHFAVIGTCKNCREASQPN